MAIYGIYKTEIEEYAKAGDWQMVKGLIAQSSDADPYKAEAEKKYGQQIATTVINRPTHQAEIEAAARLGDYAKVEKLIASIPEGDPYKASMYGLFKDKFPSATAFKSPVAGEAGFVNFPARIGTENNPEVERLVALYKKSYQEIIGEINDVTVASQAQRAASLRQIEKILTQLGVDTSTWIEDNIPVIYQQGMKQGLTQLEHMGAITIKNGKVVPAAAGAARAVSSGFTNINQEAVKALISDAQKSFGDALSTVNRSARQIFNQATQQAIKDRLATGEIAPLDRVKIANDIKQIVSDKGVAALTDKGGREWTLDRYAEMLTRTKVVEARNTGLSNKLAESGYDLVEVSSHGATDVCGDWEGKVLSLTGRTDGYPTVDDATADGLFHPNCEHAINAVVPDLSSDTNAYDNPYNALDAEGQAAADELFANR